MAMPFTYPKPRTRPTIRRALRLALFALLGFAGAGIDDGQADKKVLGSPEAIKIEARPIDVFAPGDVTRSRFGRLIFRGGLILTSSDEDFGGLSGLALDSSGAHFVAISDHGDWFAGTIRYQGGRPIALDRVEAGPLLATDGRTLAGVKWYDTEALTIAGGMAYVGIERANQIVRFDLAEGFLRARADVLTLPAAIAQLPRNKGIEGLIAVPQGLPLAGSLIAFSERGLDAAGNLKAFIIGGPRPGAFALKRTENFDVSDAALLPGGDVLVLERKFSIFSGLGIRIRKIALSAIAPGATIDGEVIFAADMADDIDNLEAIAVHRDEAGEQVITLLSDDNFSPLQRNLLLQFTLPQDDAGAREHK